MSSSTSTSTKSVQKRTPSSRAERRKKAKAKSKKRGQTKRGGLLGCCRRKSGPAAKTRPSKASKKSASKSKSSGSSKEEKPAKHRRRIVGPVLPGQPAKAKPKTTQVADAVPGTGQLVQVSAPITASPVQSNVARKAGPKTGAAQKPADPTSTTTTATPTTAPAQPKKADRPKKPTRTKKPMIRSEQENSLRNERGAMLPVEVMKMDKPLKKRRKHDKPSENVQAKHGEKSKAKPNKSVHPAESAPHAKTPQSRTPDRKKAHSSSKVLKAHGDEKEENTQESAEIDDESASHNRRSSSPSDLTPQLKSSPVATSSSPRTPQPSSDMSDYQRLLLQRDSSSSDMKSSRKPTQGPAARMEKRMDKPKLTATKYDNAYNRKTRDSSTQTTETETSDATDNYSSIYRKEKQYEFEPLEKLSSGSPPRSATTITTTTVTVPSCRSAASSGGALSPGAANLVDMVRRLAGDRDLLAHLLARARRETGSRDDAAFVADVVRILKDVLHASRVARLTGRTGIEYVMNSMVILGPDGLARCERDAERMMGALRRRRSATLRTAAQRDEHMSLVQDVFISTYHLRNWLVQLDGRLYRPQIVEATRVMERARILHRHLHAQHVALCSRDRLVRGAD